MEALLDGKFSPVPHTIGFIKCECDVVVNAYINWQETIQNKRGVSLSSRPVTGALEDVIPSLLPLTSVERRRFLFLPTNSEWTAFLDNGHQGTDVFAPLSFLAKRLSCEAVRATAIPDNSNGKYLGATIFELYGPKETHFLNYIRSVGVGFDGKRWTFSTAGEVQSYENTEQYNSKRIKDRFTSVDLDRYLNAIGIQAFDRDFYVPKGTHATLIEKFGPTAPGTKEF